MTRVDAQLVEAVMIGGILSIGTIRPTKALLLDEDEDDCSGLQ
jgi:hypothetical protein